MFGKVSEDYATNWKIHKNANLSYAEAVELRAVIYKAHKDGAEFGYNKANEWHYPSKGEYPKERQLVLGIFQPSEYYTPTELVFYGKELDCWSNQMGDSEYHNIYAWKEIVLPKEE